MKHKISVTLEVYTSGMHYKINLYSDETRQILKLQSWMFNKCHKNNNYERKYQLNEHRKYKWCFNCFKVCLLFYYNRNKIQLEYITNETEI